jgi:hypothetical protein
MAAHAVERGGEVRTGAGLKRFLVDDATGEVTGLELVGKGWHGSCHNDILQSNNKQFMTAGI